MLIKLLSKLAKEINSDGIPWDCHRATHSFSVPSSGEDAAKKTKKQKKQNQNPHTQQTKETQTISHFKFSMFKNKGMYFSNPFKTETPE